LLLAHHINDQPIVKNPQEQPMRQTPNSDKMNRISRDLIAGIALVPVSQTIFWLAGVVIFQIIGNENFDHLFVFDQVAIFLAIVQFAYLIPVTLFFRHKGRWDVVKGIAIGAILNILIVTVCTQAEIFANIITLAVSLIILVMLDRIIWLYFSALTQPERPDPQPSPNTRFNVSRDFMRGLLLALLFHGVYAGIIALAEAWTTAIWPVRDWYTEREDPFSTGSTIRFLLALMIWLIGLFQSLYLVPAMLYYKRQKRPEVVKGILRVALLTILISGNVVYLIYGFSLIIVFIPLLIASVIIAGVGFKSLKTRS
jgi:lysylphosphatidylglycerol synthetase-like protein (DUF2156 family)